MSSEHPLSDIFQKEFEEAFHSTLLAAEFFARFQEWHGVGIMNE